MAKHDPMTEAESHPPAPRELRCPNCGGNRFQVFERGKVYEDHTVTIDGRVLQCLGCHTVFDNPFEQLTPFESRF